MAWVIDCSFITALFLPEERSERAASFIRDASDEEVFHVPLLWWYEISNVLRVSVKRKRLTHADVIEILELIKSLKFSTDVDFGIEYARSLYDITGTYGLSAYDAAYLSLALEKKASLATLDDELSSAARRAGLKIYTGT